jgi:hypothetical protein
MTCVGVSGHGGIIGRSWFRSVKRGAWVSDGVCEDMGRELIVRAEIELRALLKAPGFQSSRLC